MVESRVSRVVAEVVGDEGTVGGLSRLDTILAGLRSNSAAARASRLTAEVVGSPPPIGAISRLDVLTGARRQQAAGGRVLASRLSTEVVGAPLLSAAISRLDVLTGGVRSLTSRVNVSRLVLEVVARQGSAGPIVPLPLSADLSIFLHNWATRAVMSSSYLTDVSTAPGTGAESRRGLSLKPTRTMKLEWQLCGDDDASLERLAAVETSLRRMSDQRFQVPIYMDQVELENAYTPGDTSILMPTDLGRYFPGARIVIVQLDAENQVSSYSTHIIETMTNTQLNFDAAIGVDVPAGSLVFPLMDCEVMFALNAKYETARVPRIQLTVAEVQGNNTLPPLKSDNPTSTDTFDGAPIWTFEPNWARGIGKGRSRDGSSSRSGRATLVLPKGPRSRQTHDQRFAGKRDRMWKVVEFFDTRRGRLRSFWHIDQDQYLRAAEIDVTGNFIGVTEVGNLANFQEEFEYVGLLMDDGSYFVREVANIQQVFTVFRLTLTTPLPAGLSAENVVRVARARRTRFVKDEMQESWSFTGYTTSELKMIETLNERDASI